MSLWLEDVAAGMKFQESHNIPWWRIILFAAASGDWNKIHWNPFAARHNGHNGIVAHGVLLGYVSQMVGFNVFAGGTYVTKVTDLFFRQWVTAGKVLSVSLEIKKVRHGRVVCFVCVRDERGNLVIEGITYFSVPRRK